MLADELAAKEEHKRGVAHCQLIRGNRQKTVIKGKSIVSQ